MLNLIASCYVCSDSKLVRAVKELRMKRLLAITLLTASVSHAETYICKPEAQTGLMVLESKYLVVDYSKKKVPDTFVVTRSIFSAPDIPQVLTISNTKGEKTYDCTITGEVRNSVLVCINKWNTMVFRLNTENGKYVQTDQTMTTNSDGYQGTPWPRMEAGSCDLFQQ